MSGPLILGASCDDPIRRGEALDLVLIYQNEDGSPIDLSTSVVEVASSSPEEIKERAEVTITNAPAGTVRFLLSAEDTTLLRLGPGNRFRLRATFGEDSNDLSPEIYVQVRP